MSVPASLEERSRSLATGVFLMEAFDEQFKDFLESLEEMADRSQHCILTDGEYELGFKAGMWGNAQSVLQDMRQFYRDFKRIQKEISAAVTSEPRH